MIAYRILFVCWGNICRSPTAEAILRRQVAQAGLVDVIEVDSAGISDEHAGSHPDRRARAEASRRGLDLGTLRARRVRPEDWDRFDLLLVTDAPVERILLRGAPAGPARRKVARITAFLPSGGGTAVVAPDEVPDPYYGGPDGFAQVFDLLEEACAAILAHVRRELGLASAG